jgi:hypothetical protein
MFVDEFERRARDCTERTLCAVLHGFHERAEAA